jgi:hypothetical protein
LRAPARAKVLDVDLVLLAPDRPLVRDQVVDGQHTHWDGSVGGRHAARIRLVELDRVDAREHIDAVRGDADLEDGSLGREIFDAEIGHRRPERGERDPRARRRR